MIIACHQCQLRYDVSGKTAGESIVCRCGVRLRVPRSDTAGRLQCPNCGGAVAASSPVCGYCESELAVLPCPRCFSLQFSGAQFCAQCGTTLLAAAQAVQSSALACPRCDHVLETRSYKTGSVHQCRGCGGAWLDTDSFERSIDKVRQQASLSTGLKPAPKARPIEEPPVRYLPCPECRKLMHRRNFARQSGVIVDVCKAHGVWFDRHELAAIIAYIRAGGSAELQGPPTPAALTEKNAPSPFGVHTVHQEVATSKLPGWDEIRQLLDWLPFLR